MKSLSVLALGMAISFCGFSQKVYRKADWGINETQKSGCSITRLEGENKALEITNVGYQSQDQLIDELNKKKKAGKIGGDKYKSQLSEYKEKSIGGMMYLYVVRTDEKRAHNENFTVIVKDASGSEVKKKQLRAKAPKSTKMNNGFKNDGTVFVKNKVSFPLTIEVIETTVSGEHKFVFKATE